MAAALRHLARWLAWQMGELDTPQEPPLARITVFSSGAKQMRRGKGLSGSSSA